METHLLSLSKLMRSSKEPAAPGKRICPEVAFLNFKKSVFPSEDSRCLYLGFLITELRLELRFGVSSLQEVIPREKRKKWGAGISVGRDLGKRGPTGRTSEWMLWLNSQGPPSHPPHSQILSPQGLVGRRQVLTSPELDVRVEGFHGGQI